MTLRGKIGTHTLKGTSAHARLNFWLVGMVGIIIRMDLYINFTGNIYYITIFQSSCIKCVHPFLHSDFVEVCKESTIMPSRVNKRGHGHVSVARKIRRIGVFYDNQFSVD